MNIRDIARLANVTPSTVSKVLNNYPDISEATRQNVQRIIDENRYDPRANSRYGKGAAAASRVGLVVESVYNGIYSRLEDVLSLNLHNSGYLLASFHDNFFSQDKHEKFAELKAFMERDKICAMVYIGGSFECLSEEELASLPCPTVFINTMLPRHIQQNSFSSIQVSHYETALAQMRCLIDKGHRDICTVISSASDISVYGQRTAAYRAALQENGLEQNLGGFLECDMLSAKACTMVQEYLRSHPQVTALCCAADIMLPGVLRGIHEAGRHPGEDVAVISFDGMRESEFLIPSVTTFAQPLGEMAGYADRLLLGLIGKQQGHQHLTFRPAFLQRESF